MDSAGDVKLGSIVKPEMNSSSYTVAEAWDGIVTE